MYKKIVVYSLFMTVVFSSCIKQKDVVYTQNIAELDVASFNTVFGTLTYPFITRQPIAAGRAIVAADPYIARTSGTATFRVNLIGAQRPTATIVKYTVFAVGAAVGSTVNYTYAIPNPSAPPPTITVTTSFSTFDGVSGTHYTDPGGGICTIPANSSFGTITIGIINSGITANTTALVGIELVAGGDVPVSPNYSKMSFAIWQR